MHTDQQVRFDRFRLDLENERLWEADRSISLTPKAFEVLLYLARHPGRRIAKDELLDAVWGERHVSDAVLKVAVREIRKVLGDNARSPRFIETLHRRGYRFIAEPPTGRTLALRPLAPSLVGRGTALAELRQRLEAAASGQRQVVFVTGEAGIGKTTLVEAFLAEAVGGDGWLTSGHCLEQLGPCEPYQPMLDALSRLCRGPRGEQVVELVRRSAPTWLRQMPAWIGADERSSLERETLGATSRRMLREMAETLETLAADVPLVLVLEDLHCSDDATLDLVAFLARRPDPARLLVLATHRPADAKLRRHPVEKILRELQALAHCHHLPLDYLGPEAVVDYLEQRFGPGSGIARLAERVHRHTGGNPLFMTSVLDYLQSDRRLVREGGGWRLQGSAEALDLGVPENVRQLVERQIDRLDSGDQKVLEAASVSGFEVSAASVAAALGDDLLDVEERCDRLASQRQFLRSLGARSLPDGVVTARYAFIHTLHRQVLYGRIPPARRCRLHLRVGEGGERSYGDRAAEIAAELAAHFERARTPDRAVKHLRRAAGNAVRRFANREADGYLTRALEIGDADGKVRRELLLRRGLVRRAMGDMVGAASDFEKLVESARRSHDLEQEVEALLYLVSALYWVRRERCLSIVDRAAKRAARLDERLLRAHALGYCAHWNLNLRGWNDEDAATFREALEAGQDAGDPTIESLHLVRDVYFRCWQSDYAGASRWAEEALELALDAGDAFDYLVCKFFWVWALLHRGHWRRVRPLLSQGIGMAEKNDHELWTLLFRIELAMFHHQAGDFEGALELCAEPLERAREDPQQTGQLLFKGLITAGLCYQGLGRWAEGYGCFREVQHVAVDRKVLMDRLLDLPLHEGLARHGLAQGDLVAARRAAEHLRALASAPGERTYLALSLRSLAEIAAAEERWQEADTAFDEAAETCEADDVPLAAWRVHDAAAAYHRARGRSEEAATCAGRRAAVLRQLADALGPGDPLRQPLLMRAGEAGSPE